MRVQTALKWLRAAWPMPALVGWSAAWGVFLGFDRLGVPAAFAFVLAALLGALAALVGSTPWRRVFIGAGFPLSFAALGLAAPLPAWSWLVPLALLALLYPRHSWGDAPLFPTPAGGLAGLARAVPLPDGAAVLDAGCGLGAGLRELHREYPRARLTGLEWSLPIERLCALRTPYAHVKRADIWAADWSLFDMVYLFQRPESMPRAARKAAGELRDGAWLVSLEFEAEMLEPQAVLHASDGRPVWLYRAPFVARP
jgi:hypothetical protein